MDWERIVNIEEAVADPSIKAFLKEKKISNYGFKTSVNWYRPGNSRVRHLIICNPWDTGYAACGFYNCKDPFRIDDSPKCKNCLRLTETL